MASRGRPPGAPNKKTRELQAAIESSGLTPLEFMLNTLRDEDKPYEMRLDAAKAAAPFVHARLATVNVNDVTPRKSLAELDARIVELIATIGEARALRIAGAARVIDGECEPED